MAIPNDLGQGGGFHSDAAVQVRQVLQAAEGMPAGTSLADLVAAINAIATKLDGEGGLADSYLIEMSSRGF